MVAFEFADLPAALGLARGGRLDVGAEDGVALVGELAFERELVEALQRVGHRAGVLEELDHADALLSELLGGALEEAGVVGDLAQAVAAGELADELLDLLEWDAAAADVDVRGRVGFGAPDAGA